MRMLAHDALTQALRVYDLIERARMHIGPGHEAQLRAVVMEASAIVAAEKHVLKGVLAAQKQAAQGLDRAQWPPGCRLPLRERPEPQLHPANDHAAASEQPASPVA